MASIVVCITGGSGFVGAQICRLMAEKKHLQMRVDEIRVLDLVPPRGSQFDAWGSGEPESVKAPPGGVPRLKFFQGSVCDKAVCAGAFAGADVVIHTASMVDFGNRPAESILQVNVGGTETVVAACLEANVATLIYTSSLDSITFWGDCRGVLSDGPYPSSAKENSSGIYGYSKSLAEKAVLQANGSACKDGKTTLSTCALRPRGVYGEGDPFYMTTIVWVTSKLGSLVSRIGDGTAKNDHIYAGNVAYAHICAIRALCGADEVARKRVAGRPFNLSHEPPVPIYVKATPFLEAFKLKPPATSVNATAMHYLALVLEILFKAIPRRVRPTLLLTRESVEAISTEKTFADPAALRDLGFEPLYSVEEAVCRTIQWLRTEWPDRPNQESNQSGSFSHVRWFLLSVVVATLARWIVFRSSGF